MLSSTSQTAVAAAAQCRKSAGPRPAAHPAAAAAVPSRAPHRAAAAAPSPPRHDTVLTRAISRVIKISDPPSGTRSLRAPPTPSAARMIMPTAPPPSLAPTRREAMFTLFGAVVGGAGVATYFKSVYDVDLEAAKTALGVMLDDPAFLETVAQEVLYEEFHDDETAVAKAISSEQQVEQELRDMTKQMEDMRKQVNEITQLAEARTAKAAPS